jgi:hypothetical protein
MYGFDIYLPGEEGCSDCPEFGVEQFTYSGTSCSYTIAGVSMEFDPDGTMSGWAEIWSEQESSSSDSGNGMWVFSESDVRLTGFLTRP